MAVVREEMPSDHQDVHELNCLAFETDAEAKLVDALRQAARPFISLVAIEDDKVVGHIAFTPVSVGGGPASSKTMGLAPMAVTPALQKQGIGSALVRAGLEECATAGAELVFVLGHPSYYPKFGFLPAAAFGLHYKESKLDPYFFVTELANDALAGVSGEVAYHSLFDSVG